MTLKSKSTGKKQFVPKESPGFTESETKLISQLETKKKTKLGKHVEEESSKIGKMFKKKKTVVEDDDVEENPKVVKKKSKKEAMEVDEDTFETVKASKIGGSKDVDSSTVIPGFSAPKKAAPKRRHEGEDVPAKKAKKATGEQKTEFNKAQKKALKVERKTKENENRYLLSVKAKKLWEDLRREYTAKEKQLAISAELYGLIKGHTQEVSCHLKFNSCFTYTKFYDFSVGVCS